MAWGRKLAEAFVMLRADSSQLSSGLKKSEGMLGASVGRMQSMLANLGLAFGSAMAVRSAFNAFQGFEQAMASSTAIIVGLTNEQRRAMETMAKDVARNSMHSAQQLSQAYYYLASAGLDAEQQMKALPVVAKFATAGMFDLSQATDLLTDAQSALGLTVSDAAQNQKNMLRVSDALVRANTMANASVQQFSEALTNKAAASMRMVGMEIEEGLAVLAAFADQGIKGAEAGTQFGIVLRDLKSKFIDNKQRFLEMGIQVFDSTGKMNRMSDVIRALGKRMASMSAETKTATLMNLGFADKSVSALQVLLGMEDRIDKYNAGLNEAAGFTEQVANKQIPALTRALKDLRTEWELMAIDLGKGVDSPLVSIVHAMQSVVNWFGYGIAAIQDFVAVATTGLPLVGAKIDDFFGLGDPKRLKELETAWSKLAARGTLVERLVDAELVRYIKEQNEANKENTKATDVQAKAVQENTAAVSGLTDQQKRAAQDPKTKELAIKFGRLGGELVRDWFGPMKIDLSPSTFKSMASTIGESVYDAIKSAFSEDIMTTTIKAKELKTDHFDMLQGAEDYWMLLQKAVGKQDDKDVKDKEVLTRVGVLATAVTTLVDAARDTLAAGPLGWRRRLKTKAIGESAIKGAATAAASALDLPTTTADWKDWWTGKRSSVFSKTGTSQMGWPEPPTTSQRSWDLSGASQRGWLDPRAIATASWNMIPQAIKKQTASDMWNEMMRTQMAGYGMPPQDEEMTRLAEVGNSYAKQMLDTLSRIEQHVAPDKQKESIAVASW